MLIKVAHYLTTLLVFIIPLAWWTRLNANYYSTKLTLFFLVGALAWLAIPTRITLPKLPKALLLSLGGIVFFQIAKHAYNLNLDELLHFSKFLSFAALVFWLYSLNLDLENIYRKTTYAVLLTTVLILGVSIYEYFNIRLLNLSTDVSSSVGTFGNVNMFAEYFILTIPFIFHWARHTDKVPKGLKLLIFSLWIFFILYCRSRSAWIGLALWLALQFRYKITRKELLYIGLAFTMCFANIYAPSIKSTLNQVKEDSATFRLVLYKSSIELIKDNPWGIKAGSFLGEIEPYLMESPQTISESSYYDQPHSEILKWGAQFGWVFLGLSAVFLLMVSYQLGRWFLHQKNQFLVGSFVVLLPQILFQFPFENPASLLFLSLVVALYFKEFASGKVLCVHFSYRPIAFLLFLAGVYSSAGFVYSVYQESTIPRNEQIITACDYYPINIKTCFAKLTYYIDTKQYDRFLTDFKIDFLKQPFFVDYLRLLPTYYSIKQNNKKTCEALFLYETIFPKQKAFESKYYENCKGFSNIFYFDEPAKFKARYLAWLDNLS